MIQHSQIQLFQGTSIGALVGGLYAKEVDLISSSARTKQFSGRLGNIWRLLSDVTYPLVAYTTVCAVFFFGFHLGLTCRIRDTSSTDHCTRHSMTCISKICGCHSSAILRTSRLLVWRYTRLVTLGGLFVGHQYFVCPH
jgi:hypothetical protein